jgi:hypothetical protein
METNVLLMFRQTLKFDGDTIPVKPLCDFFNIKYSFQVSKIKNDAILKFQFHKKGNETIFGDKIRRIFLTKEGFLRWITLINPKIVHVSLRENLIEYQKNIFKFLFGKIEEQKTISNEITFHHYRIKKLKKVASYCGNEIKREEKILTYLIDSQYPQTRLQFTESQPQTKPKPYSQSA